MSDLSGIVTAAWVSGTNTVLICSRNSPSNNCIIRSDDAGLTWVSQNTTPVSNIQEIDYSRYNDLIIAYSISSTGEVLRSRQMVQPVGIQQTGNTIPYDYSLSQNFPNPFNPVTVIRYSLFENRFVKLRVYDVLGNEIATLVNEKQNAGSYSVDFNAGKLPSGIYYYTIKAGEFTDTRKMMLVK